MVVYVACANGKVFTKKDNFDVWYLFFELRFLASFTFYYDNLYSRESFLFIWIMILCIALISIWRKKNRQAVQQPYNQTHGKSIESTKISNFMIYLWITHIHRSIWTAITNSVDEQKIFFLFIHPTEQRQIQHFYWLNPIHTQMPSPILVDSVFYTQYTYNNCIEWRIKRFEWEKREL